MCTGLLIRRGFAVVLMAVAATAEVPNRVLELDGDGDFVRLPTNLFVDAEDITIEAWVRWHRFADFSQPFGFGRAWHGIFLNNQENTPALQFYAYLGEQHLELIRVPDILQLDRWHHVAAIAGAGGMKLYLDGVLVGQRPFSGALAAPTSEPFNVLGGAHWQDNDEFDGQLDEVRIWRRARSAEEVRHDMYRRLRGDEQGLLALWNFDADDARDVSPRGAHGKLEGDARTTLAHLPSATAQVPSVIRGSVIDDADRPLPNATVRLYVEGRMAHEILTDVSGRFHLSFYGETFDLSVVHEDRGVWREGLSTGSGTPLHLRLKLRRALSISGRVQALDGSAHVGVPVQAIDVGADDRRPLTVNTDADGGYRFINLRPGRYRVRCLSLSGTIDDGRDLTVGADHQAIDIDFKFSRHRSGNWKAFTYLDGLSSHMLSAITTGQDGRLWLGSLGGGLFHFDGRAFQRLTQRDGLAGNQVRALHEDDDGTLWIASAGGLSRLRNNVLTGISVDQGLPGTDMYDIVRGPEGDLLMATPTALIRAVADSTQPLGLAFHSYGQAEGLTTPWVFSLLIDADGKMWLGTAAGLVSYDGVHFVSHGDPDVSLGVITHLYQDVDGALLLGTTAGLARYDGASFQRLTAADGLPGDIVTALYRDSQQHLWIGTNGGLARLAHPTWPGEEEIAAGLHLTNYTDPAGTSALHITALQPDQNNTLWVTTAAGLMRYTEDIVTPWTTAEGLPDNDVAALRRDVDGTMWIATHGGLGRLRDGQITRYTTAEGLPSNHVWGLHRGPHGGLWLGLSGGVSRLGDEGLSNTTASQGLLGDLFTSIATDGREQLWFGSHSYGVYMYDGRTFTRRPLGEGQPHVVNALLYDNDGTMWVGSEQGLTGYLNDDVTTYTRADGLAGNTVYSIYRDPQGPLWIGTEDGLSRLSDSRLTSFSEVDGLAGGTVFAIQRMTSGLLALGTLSGLCLFDGSTWSMLDSRDGLGGNRVRALLAEDNGDLWVGTDGGLTRYRRGHGQPRAHIVSVQADSLFTDLDQAPRLQAGSRVTVTYGAVDLHTRPGGHQYRRRLLDGDGAVLQGWHVTRESTFDAPVEDPGAYTLEVVAIDRDLRHSPVARVDLLLVPAWHDNPWITSGFGFSIVGLVLTSVFYSRRFYLQQRETRRLREDMLEQERRARLKVEATYQEVQRLLRQEERAAVILRGWAHAVKSPLTIIRRQLEDSGGAPPANLHDRVRVIVDTVDRMLGAAVDLQFRHFELQAELNLLCYRTVQQFPRVTFTPSPGGPVRIQADHAKLMMAFENLFLNACQAASAGSGHVWLEIEATADRVRVSVRDDGPGIATRVRERLFEHTVTTRKDDGGTGLGLLIVRHVIEAHGGRVEVQQSSSAGTRMGVELPLSAGPNQRDDDNT